MNGSSGQQSATPADLKNVVSEILQSDEFCNQLRRSIERASTNTVSHNSSAPAQRIPVATPSEELRRLFPSIRHSNNNEIVNRNASIRVGANHVSERPRKRKHGGKTQLPDFKREVILIDKPEVTRTLNGRQKGAAYANGYAVSAATFQKKWVEKDILEYIENLFVEKLHGIKFEILVPIGGTLVRPNLPQGTAIDGTIMCHLFAQKIVYVRTLRETDGEPESGDFGENSNHTFEKSINENHVLAGNEPLSKNEVEVDIDQCHSSAQVSDEADLIEQAFENDTIAAITRSLEEQNEETIIDVLRQLHNRIDPETTSHFNIYREDIFNCCVRALRRNSFSPLNKISVLFTDIDDVSEGAVDMGGPTREMFRLLLKYLANSTLFEGSKHCKNITLCNEHLESKHYYEAGRIIALSLIHGGPSPQFFSETLFNYLINGVEATKPCVDEIMNSEIRSELESIRNAPDLPELQLAIWNSTFMAIAGFGTGTSFDKKDAILESATKYYLIHRAMPALEQFKEGLNTLGLLDKLKVFIAEFKDLMCYTNSKLTADQVSFTFKVKLSEIGSNRRNIESRILAFWNDFLLDSQERETQASLEDVLCFATASEKIPPLGFENQPQLEFLHDEEFLWPKANTCVPILYLPISYKSNEYEKFRNNMDYAILNGMQFGFA